MGAMGTLKCSPDNSPRLSAISTVALNNLGLGSEGSREDRRLHVQRLHLQHIHLLAHHGHSTGFTARSARRTRTVPSLPTSQAKVSPASTPRALRISGGIPIPRCWLRRWFSCCACSARRSTNSTLPKVQSMATAAVTYTPVMNDIILLLQVRTASWMLWCCRAGMRSCGRCRRPRLLPSATCHLPPKSPLLSPRMPTGTSPEPSSRTNVVSQVGKTGMPTTR